MSGKRTTVDLRPSQRRAVDALARGASIKAAAAAAGVAERTVYKWRQTPEFVAALQAVDAANLKEMSRQLTAASLDAISVLADVVRNEKISASVRIRAAAEILRYRADFYKLTDLAERVEKLERGVTHDEH